jgi:serine/threonine-protein kinase RsbW
VPNDAAELPALAKFLRDFWSECGLPPAEALNFELALEEVFMNVVMHGSPPGGVGRVEVFLAFVDGEVTLTVEDDGPPFDPLLLPPPDITADLESRRVGGLGVFLVRRVMDNVRYRRRETMNQLQMTKNLAGAVPARSPPR